MKKNQEKPKKKKVTIRCRTCFMTDSYVIENENLKCRHCGSKIYIIDAL